jgi:hypothetical protein
MAYMVPLDSVLVAGRCLHDGMGFQSFAGPEPLFSGEPVGDGLSLGSGRLTLRQSSRHSRGDPFCLLVGSTRSWVAVQQGLFRRVNISDWPAVAGLVR